MSNSPSISLVDDHKSVRTSKDFCREEIRTTLDSMKKFLLEKNERYGNSALYPISVFTSFIKTDNQALHNMLVRLDDKLKRIENADELRKNDVADIIGYLILLCINQGWNDFSDLID